MSMFRKTVLTTAIIGAGLASTTGAAFAGDCPDSGSKSHGHESSESGHQASGIGCANGTEAENNNGGEAALGGILGGSQAISSLNLCDNLNGNSILSNNNIALGDIQNGDNTEITETRTAAETVGRDSAATVTPIQG